MDEVATVEAGTPVVIRVEKKDDGKTIITTHDGAGTIYGGTFEPDTADPERIVGDFEDTMLMVIVFVVDQIGGNPTFEGYEPSGRTLGHVRSLVAERDGESVAA